MVGIPGFSAQLHFLTTNGCSLKCAKNCAKSYVWKVLQRFRFEAHLADSVSERFSSSSSLPTIMGVASVSDSLGRVFSLGGAAITINPTHQHSKAKAATLQNCCFGHRLESGVADCGSQFFCSFLTQKPWEFHRKVHFPHSRQRSVPMIAPVERVHYVQPCAREKGKFYILFAAINPENWRKFIRSAFCQSNTISTATGWA